MPATVIADVFSGLPNPQWTIAGDVLAQLQLLLANLAPFHGGLVPKPPPLGYRGLIVQFAPGESLQVWNGYVVGARETWLDPDRRVERWLLETGIRAIDAGILKEILTEIR
ncbi:hypothetical protein [Bradyrhizobium sp.]